MSVGYVMLLSCSLARQRVDERYVSLHFRTYA
jgi:hypothetical protein